MTSSVPVLKAHVLLPLTHGFFTRQGGVSQGIYKSLNCGLRENMEEPHTDTRENVLKNRQIALETLGLAPKELLTLKQVHGKKVEIVEDSWRGPRAADAFLTKREDVALAISTADCVPILIADLKNNIVGAIHAGWRGALTGVVEETLETLKAMGGTLKSTVAAIGPCISQASYEVGAELKDAFLQKNPENQIFFKEQETSDQIFFDLPGYVEACLSKFKLKEIERLPYDTYEDEKLFFSCRRATHRKQKGFGNNFSIISRAPSV